MRELLNRNQDGLLSVAEREELQSYAQAACWLGILHSRARRRLGNQRCCR
jgi:hypothetical protein